MILQLENADNLLQNLNVNNNIFPQDALDNTQLLLNLLINQQLARTYT